MRATERYERAWNAFQIHLNHNPKASLIPFLKERHVNHRSMHGVWKMEESSDELLGMLEHKADYSSFLERVSAEKRRQERFASRGEYTASILTDSFFTLRIIFSFVLSKYVSRISDNI